MKDLVEVKGLILGLGKWPGLGTWRRGNKGIPGSERRIYGEFKKNKST